jgi:hypothetical protein
MVPSVKGVAGRTIAHRAKEEPKLAGESRVSRSTDLAALIRASGSDAEHG